MKISVSLVLCLLLSHCVFLHSQDGHTPAVDGYVTRINSTGEFDVNGIRVQCGAETATLVLDPSGTGTKTLGCPAGAPFVGERMRIFGSKNKKSHSVNATQIEILSLKVEAIEGSAVIEELIPEAHAPGELLLRADGYRIRITAKTETSWNPPLQALSDVSAGDWLEFKGKQDAQGTVIVSAAKIARAVVGKGEEKLRAKSDFDASAAPQSAKQSKTRMAWGGNPMRLPPYNDPAMQTRINEIGEKLIPACQRNLPDSDPAKIHFRFRLIDTTAYRDALTLPSGIILIPRQVVERLQNDSQLATVLADNIATALERQTYRAIPASRALLAGQLGADAVGFVVPGVFLISPALVIGGEEVIRVKAEEQSGRVSLGLLHDAGYDVDQAPLAWWLLAPKKLEPISETKLPHRAAYLYQILGETWHNPAISNQPKT